MKKQYTRKQITEALAYWEKQLKKLSESEDTFFTLKTCDRCGGSLSSGRIMSMYNTDCICMKCAKEERQRKDYKKAQDAEAAAVRRGDTNFKGIGLNEVLHDGLHTPKYPTRRNETDKPTIYYIGVDEYSDNFSDYGHYVMPNGNLTKDASNNNFKSAAVTRVPASLKSMVDKALAKYGKDKYIFVFKEEYTYGTLTHKSHARPSVMDIWYPNGLYWRYGLQPIEQLSRSQEVNEATIDIPDSKIAPIMDLVIETPLDNGVNIHIETDDDGIDIVQEIVSILKNGIHRRFPNKIDGVDFVHFYAK